MTASLGMNLRADSAAAFSLARAFSRGEAHAAAEPPRACWPASAPLRWNCERGGDNNRTGNQNSP